MLAERRSAEGRTLVGGACLPCPENAICLSAGVVWACPTHTSTQGLQLGEQLDRLRGLRHPLRGTGAERGRGGEQHVPLAVRR
eukprot:2340392-Rhodomonas_salina.1